MIGPNLSEWALGRRSLVVFFMLMALVAGTLAFKGLGRGEDPVLTIRTMVVSAAWPGATLEDTLTQVTERIERKLQETRHLERIRSYTTAGTTIIFVELEQSTPAAAVPDVWYQVRKNVSDIRTLPQGVLGPGFNDDFGDTYGIIYGFTADGFTQRALRDYVEEVRSRLLSVPDVSKIEILGAQDERIYLEFSTARLAGLGLSYSALAQQLQAQNLVRPTGVIQTGDERIFLRVSGGARGRVGLPAGWRFPRLSAACPRFRSRKDRTRGKSTRSRRPRFSDGSTRTTFPSRTGRRRASTRRSTSRASSSRSSI